MDQELVTPRQFASCPSCGRTLHFLARCGWAYGDVGGFYWQRCECGWEGSGFEAATATRRGTGRPPPTRSITAISTTTVLGITRLGSVTAGAFEPEQQLISDSLRNAAMRFGIALDLWARGELESSR